MMLRGGFRDESPDHSSSVPFAIKYGRAPGVALIRSWSSDGHFRRTAGAAKFIFMSVSDIPNNPGEILSRQQSFIMFLPSQGALFWVSNLASRQVSSTGIHTNPEQLLGWCSRRGHSDSRRRTDRLGRRLVHQPIMIILRQGIVCRNRCLSEYPRPGSLQRLSSRCNATPHTLRSVGGLSADAKSAAIIPPKYLGSDSRLAPARPALYSLSDVVFGTIAHPVACCFPGRLLASNISTTTAPDLKVLSFMHIDRVLFFGIGLMSAVVPSTHRRLTILQSGAASIANAVREIRPSWRSSIRPRPCACHGEVPPRWRYSRPHCLLERARLRPADPQRAQSRVRGDAHAKKRRPNSQSTVAEACDRQLHQSPSQSGGRRW